MHCNGTSYGPLVPAGVIGSPPQRTGQPAGGQANLLAGSNRLRF